MNPYEQSTWQQAGQDLIKVGLKTLGTDLLLYTTSLDYLTNFDAMIGFTVTIGILNLGLSKLNEKTHIDPAVPGLSEAESLLLVINSLAIPLLITSPLDVATKSLALAGLIVTNYQLLYGLHAYSKFHR